MPQKEFYVFFGMGTQHEGKYAVVRASSLDKAISAAYERWVVGMFQTYAPQKEARYWQT